MIFVHVVVDVWPLGFLHAPDVWSPFPLWVHVVVVSVLPFRNAIALELIRGAIANASTAAAIAAVARTLTFFMFAVIFPQAR